MAKLFLRNAYEFENPSRRIFLAGELFEGAASQQAKKTKDYFKNGESTPEAIKLAADVEKQAEEIRKGTNKELLSLYVDLFHSLKIPERDSLSGPETRVDAKFEKQGILAVAAAICPDLGTAYKLYPDLQLLSYATVFNNLKDDKGVKADANKLPIGATVRVDNGIVYVTYEVDKVKTTFHSELFPWNSYDEAYVKWQANNAEEAAAKEAEYQRNGRPDDGLDADGNPIVRAAPDVPAEPVAQVTPANVEAVDERTDYEKRLDAKVDTFRDGHGLTEPGERIGVQLTEDQGIGTYNASLRTPAGEIVTINVRATVPEGTPEAGLEQALEKALDEGLARLDKTLGREEKKEADEAPTDLEKDWQRVWESVQKMVAADSRLTGKVTVKEGPRNVRGDDKTILVTNADGDTLRYMVGVKEKNTPKSYGPAEGATPDAAHLEDVKSIRITLLVIGNGNDNKTIGERVSKYSRLEDYRISSVEKGAYNAALIMAGIDPIEEPSSPSLIEVLFKGRGGRADETGQEPRERSDAARYEKRLDAKVDTFRDGHGLTEPGERIGVQLTEDQGIGTYNASLRTPAGEIVTINVRATVPEGTPEAGLEQALEKALDEGLARLDRVLGRKEASSEEVDDPRDAALKAEWLSKVKPTLQALEAMYPGVRISFTGASFTKRENKPDDEVDPFPNYGKHGKTISIQFGPKQTDVKRYQILVPKAATSYLDASVVINEDINKNLGITWKEVDRSTGRDLYDYFTTEMDRLNKEHVLDSIRVRDIARLNKLPPVQQLFYLEWYALHTLELAQKDPATLTEAEQKDLYNFYSKGVEMEVTETWYLELQPKLPSGDAIIQQRMSTLADNIRALQELRKAHPYEGLSEKKVAELEAEALMDAQFSRNVAGKSVLAAGGSWQEVDAQYKKLRETVPDGRISAMHHFRGAQAAATAGRIDDCVHSLELAAKNAEKGSSLEGDVKTYQDYFKKNFEPVSLKGAPGATFVYSATKKEGTSVEFPAVYDNAAIKLAQTSLQKTGRFEGLLPNGTYITTPM